MDEVRPWLYIGRYRETINWGLLQRHGIGAMLQLAELVEWSGIESLYLPVDDGVETAFGHLKKGVEFIMAQKSEGQRVLVACGAGISRSAVFTVAALKEAEGLSLLDALRQVKNLHPEAAPHPSPWESLCRFYGEPYSLREALAIIRGK